MEAALEEMKKFREIQIQWDRLSEECSDLEEKKTQAWQQVNDAEQMEDELRDDLIEAYYGLEKLNREFYLSKKELEHIWEMKNQTLGSGLYDLKVRKEKQTKNHIPFLPFYEAVDFTEYVSMQDRDLLECQLEDEKCNNCDRTAYQKAKEKCDNRKIQLEKKYKNMMVGSYVSPVFLNVCNPLFGTLGKEIVNLLQEFITGADSFGQLSSGISNSIVSGIVYWLIAGIVIGFLFVITGLLIIGIGYQVEKIYRKYCRDIINIMVAIMSTAIAIYFGDWIISVKTDS